MRITHKETSIRLQTNIDANLHHRFKVSCFLHGKGMNEVLTELITSWLETEEEKVTLNVPASNISTKNR